MKKIIGLALLWCSLSVLGADEFKCEVYVVPMSPPGGSIPNHQLASFTTKEFGVHTHYLNVFNRQLRFFVEFSQIKGKGTYLGLSYLDPKTGDVLREASFYSKSNVSDATIFVPTRDGYNVEKEYHEMGFHCSR